MAKLKTKYVCKECGYQSLAWMGKCPMCQEWDTLEEEIKPSESKRSLTNEPGTQKPERITKIVPQEEERMTVEMEEFNRVLGGGIVPGSMVLIGGDPGIGKSTLLLQISNQVAKQGRGVLYISGEESIQQTKLRADRLKVTSDELYVLTETNLQYITHQIVEDKPSLVIIDSIQTMFKEDVASAPGSVTQVRECTMELMKIAKTHGIPIFLVGHVTKEGAIAGPRMLEHMVDAVLYFEGERHHTYRILRSVKNRFGSTNEMGIFEMKELGLVEVLNPSEVFLEERSNGASGSTVVASMEGTRPVLVEIQALISPSSFGNPRRMATGVDSARVPLLMAVLEKRVGLMLQNQDAYIKVAGGVKLDEPAIDLAVAISIASSFKDQPTSPEDIYIGEVGLTGEIRRVSRIEQRVKEAAKLGFKRIICSKNNLDGWTVPKGIEVVGVNTVQEALRLGLGI
ncbi:MAG TPA: DNA repair protein RadA [Pseudogracilibacillus sp.]|nr:DNA repair protein RadA [Pseudogracilibacillus sp.]